MCIGAVAAKHMAEVDYNVLAYGVLFASFTTIYSKVKASSKHWVNI